MCIYYSRAKTPSSRSRLNHVARAPDVRRGEDRLYLLLAPGSEPPSLSLSTDIGGNLSHFHTLPFYPFIAIFEKQSGQRTYIFECENNTYLQTAGEMRVQNPKISV